MNFSQGCTLTSSFLLYHQAQYPNRKPPFKVAIFICGGVPLNVVEDLGVFVSQEAKEWDESSKQALQAKASSKAILRKGTERWGEGFGPFAHDKQDNDNVFGIDFSRVPKEMLIQIPTVHVYGRRDPRFPASVTLAHFCEGSVRRTFDHGGGHDIPRTRDVSEMMRELIDWAGMMADRW
jgi:pimeloyl-ACP methyl ester carboxylesterase